MSPIVRLKIAGWTTTAAMIALFALNESEELVAIHKRIGEWLETLAPTADVRGEESGS